MLCKLIEWNDDSLKSRLPLLADTSVDLTLTVFGLSDFISSDLLSRTSYFIGVLFSFAQHYVRVLCHASLSASLLLKAGLITLFPLPCNFVILFFSHQTY